MSVDRFSEMTMHETQSAASAFVMVPLAVQATMTGVEQMYRQAYEQAQAVVRPSIVERLSANLVN